MPTKTKTKSEARTRRTRRATVDPVVASVQRLYDKSAPLLICESIFFALAAVFMFMRPMVFMTVLTFAIGIGLVIFGLYRTIAGFVSSRAVGGGWLDVLFGLMNIVLGILFCIYPVGAAISVIYIFVILFLFKALRALIFAINMARARFGHYVFDIIMSIILVALAVLLLVYPLAGAVAVTFWLALTLLLYAGADLYMYFELRRLKKVVSD